MRFRLRHIELVVRVAEYYSTSTVPFMFIAACGSQ